MTLSVSAGSEHFQSAIEDQLAIGIDRLGLVLPTEPRRRLIDFLRMLAKWGSTFNLTAVRDPVDMLAVHLLDSLALVPLIDRLAISTIIDVGSGAGLPGIPLAIARPGWAVQTVDAVAKKISFQRQVKAQLGLTNLDPTHQRVEALTSQERPTLVVSRAYAPLGKMLDSIHNLVTNDTVVVAMKGAIPTDELAALPARWTVRNVADLDVPFLGARRCAVVLTPAVP